MEKSRLKNYFKTGARPTESQFGQLIDAMALEEEVLKEEALAPVTEALNSQEGRLSAVETACASQTTDVATLQTAVDDLRTAEAGHGERLESLEQLMDDQWQTIDGIDLKATLVAQQVVDHPEAEELGHFDTVEELDAALSEALEGFCAQGVYASYVWNDEYGIRSRRYELDPDTGLPVATGERCIGTVTASVGTPAKACTTWLTYTLYDYEHDGGNPAPESRLERPVYEVQAVRRRGGAEFAGLFRRNVHAEDPVGAGFGGVAGKRFVAVREKRVAVAEKHDRDVESRVAEPAHELQRPAHVHAPRDGALRRALDHRAVGRRIGKRKPQFDHVGSSARRFFERAERGLGVGIPGREVDHEGLAARFGERREFPVDSVHVFFSYRAEARPNPSA